MKNKLFFNGKIYTQADDVYPSGLIVDSIAISGSTIIAAGKNLHLDPDFKKFKMIDLKGRAVIPGLVDAHTHYYFSVLTRATAKLDGLKSLDETLSVVKNHAKRIGKAEWVIGEGFAPDRWNRYVMPDKFMLDKISGGRPAAIWSKDQHMMWVNSKALEIAGIGKSTKQPSGGRIERLENGEPSGILKEIPGYFPVVKNIKKMPEAKIIKLHRETIKDLYTRGVTAVHSMDGPDSLSFYDKLSKSKKLGLRVNYYPPGSYLPELNKRKIEFDYGNDYFRVSGLKMFADGSLGSQTALCFNKYIGSKDNFGVEATPVSEMLKTATDGARLGFPCAIHAIGDRAVDNVISVFEKAPKLPPGRYHRIEHLQMIRRRDIARLKRLPVVASMQPSHCPSDINMIEKYWGKRGANCYIFKTLLKNNIPLAFGSDAPIEPLDPLAGIYDAVNRNVGPGKKVFYPDERLTIPEAVYNFTVGPAFAVGQAHERGFLLPGFKADMVVLNENIYKTPKSRLRGIRPIATIFDGDIVYYDGNLKV